VVVASDPLTGRTAPRRVARVFRRESDHLQLLRVKNSDGRRQLIETTGEHPFWAAGRGWYKAGDLEPGDQLVEPDGRLAVVLENTVDPRPEGVAVFNFEVEGLHTYFVAARGSRGPPLLAHNNNECAAQGPLKGDNADDLGRAVGSSHAGRLGLQHSDVVTVAVTKAVNSDLPHAAQRAVERGVFANAKEAADALRQLSRQITKEGLPTGTIADPRRADSVLVPFGKGKAVYEIAKNGTAKLRTVLGE
jgi:hypothetical protein